MVAVMAPAGYGKTTLLALWAEADERPFAWVSLDEHDNDPITLLTHLAVAVDRISPLPPDTFAALRSGGTSVPATVVPRLGSALARVPHPLVLVVDDVHHLRDGAALDALVTLVGHVGVATQIALAGRGMPVPLARQRAQGQVVDVDARDLAFTEEGARELLEAAGVELTDDELAVLAERTEGWAAGLYLAALSRMEALVGLRSSLPGAADGLVWEYLRAELLAGLPARDVDFLTRTAVLDRLSGPLCDAVLQQPGSAARLAHLTVGEPLPRAARRAAAVVPLPPALPGPAPDPPGQREPGSRARNCSAGRPPGTRPTASSRRPCTTPSGPGTWTGSPGGRSCSGSRCTRRAGRPPPWGGSSGSPSGAASTGTRRSPRSPPGCAC